MKFCTNCGRAYENNAYNFCIHCGGAVVEAKTCAACGARLEDDARFCTQCGTRVGNKICECGAENEDDASFCVECGKCLKPQEYTLPPVKRGSWLLACLGFLGAFAVLTVICMII